MAGEVPTGQAALHPLWPEAVWNVSGLCVRDRLIHEAHVLVRERLGCWLPVQGVHGAPAVPWNSGRFSQAQVRLDALEKIIGLFNGLGIGVFYTFTSHLIDEEGLGEPTCNRMLELVDNGRGLNGVILASELLYGYIRERHPGLKLTASIVKVTLEDGRGEPDYYKGLAERFDSVMLHPDDVFDTALLGQLDRDKMEIIVNENCVLNCPVRKEHYELMARQQREGLYAKYETTPLARHEATRCQMPLQRRDSTQRSCNMTPDELKRVYEMGFRRFKLQGRADSPMCFLYDFFRYMLEPDLVVPVVFKSFAGGWAKQHMAALAKEGRA